MTCAELRDRLDDAVDGLLSETDFQEAELHLAACAACRLEERRMRALLAHAAALPREVAPGRDLWPGIASRLGSRRLLPFARRPSSAGVAARQTWLVPALASAAAVLALSALVPRAREVTPASPAGVQTSARAQTGLVSAEADYARATADLMQALEAKRAELPPATAEALERNLHTIDQALRDIRVALRQDPGNAQLALLLNATHRRKVGFLQQIMKLSTRL